MPPPTLLSPAVFLLFDAFSSGLATRFRFTPELALRQRPSLATR